MPASQHRNCATRPARRNQRFVLARTSASGAAGIPFSITRDVRTSARSSPTSMAAMPIETFNLSTQGVRVERAAGLP